MSQSLTEFLSNIDSLIRHLKYEKETQLYLRRGAKNYSGNTDFEIEFRDLINKVLDKSFLQSRVYSYQNAIISLYGYLERFIEDIIIEYLTSISNVCPKHDSLPSSIIKNHLKLSLELINKIQKNKSWSNDKKKKNLGKAIDNISGFLQEGDLYNINYEAFIIHTSNFRYGSIHDIFKNVGIVDISKKCLDNKHFIQNLSEAHSIDGSTDNKVFESLLITELDDLAQRRNEIAHGARIDNIESIDMLISKIKLIKSYVLAIDYIVMCELEKYIFEVREKIALGKADKIFSKINVIGFKKIKCHDNLTINKQISEGDLLFAASTNNNEEHISGEIISLLKNGEKNQEIQLPCDCPVTMEVNFEVSTKIAKSLFYVISKNQN